MVLADTEKSDWMRVSMVQKYALWDSVQQTLRGSEKSDVKRGSEQNAPEINAKERQEYLEKELEFFLEYDNQRIKFNV
jgi:hypothetical protein